MAPVKIHFGFNYWLQQLIAAGQCIEPEKYTDAHILHIERCWQNQPLTRLHFMVRQRQAEALKTKQNVSPVNT